MDEDDVLDEIAEKTMGKVAAMVCIVTGRVTDHRYATDARREALFALVACNDLLTAAFRRIEDGEEDDR